jgi:hypothetical protein
MQPKTTILVTCLIAGGIFPLNTSAGQAVLQSRYTSLEDCSVLDSAPDEAGYRKSLCPGMGTYKVLLVEADDRHNLIVTGPEGKEHSLRLPSLSGGGFSVLGKRAEWLGTTIKGKFSPTAMIVRYEVTENAAEPEKWTSYLLTIALRPTPCLAAKTPPGSGQNQQARDVANSPMRCL